VVTLTRPRLKKLTPICLCHFVQLHRLEFASPSGAVRLPWTRRRDHGSLCPPGRNLLWRRRRRQADDNFLASPGARKGPKLTPGCPGQLGPACQLALDISGPPSEISWAAARPHPGVTARGSRRGASPEILRVKQSRPAIIKRAPQLPGSPTWPAQMTVFGVTFSGTFFVGGGYLPGWTRSESGCERCLGRVSEKINI
jgi:hypothetical protein